MINTAVQGFSGNLGGQGSFWKAMGIGALSGAAGFGAGALMSSVVAPVGVIGGGLTGAAGGAAGGFVGGAGNAWANGASFGDGLKAGLIGGSWGALGGAVLGGITGGITAYKHGGNLLTGEGAIFTSDFLGTGVTEAKNASINTNKQVLNLLEEKGVNLTELNVSSVSVEGEVTIPENDFYYFRGDDGIVYKIPINGGASTTIGGVTYNTIHNLRPAPANIFLSPHNSIPNLMITMNHEFIHAYQFAQFGYKNQTEWNAFKETSAYLNTQLYKPFTQIPPYSGRLWWKHLYNWPKLPSVY
jgi:hypothetical protein